jgi:biopolymer transport protein ExbD
MKYYINLLFVLTHFMLILLSCTTTDNATNVNNQQNSSSNQKQRKNTGNIIPYILERGEGLVVFIDTQYKLNEYAKHENEPTDIFYKDKYSQYEQFAKIIKNAIEESGHFGDIDNIDRGKDILPGITYDEMMNRMENIGFLYKIEYNKNNKLWYLELIGRSTTLKLGFSNSRFEGFRYGHDVRPYIRSWMELNQVKSLDFVMRIYINDIEDDTFPEFFGLRYVE